MPGHVYTTSGRPNPYLRAIMFEALPEAIQARPVLCAARVYLQLRSAVPIEAQAFDLFRSVREATKCRLGSNIQ